MQFIKHEVIYGLVFHRNNSSKQHVLACQLMRTVIQMTFDVTVHLYNYSKKQEEVIFKPKDA